MQTLDLRDNQLPALPESIGELAALKILYLRLNQLAALPESIGRLAALQELNLSSNQLATLPESIGELAVLQLLSLTNNQLTALPESIGRLAALQTLDLRDNQLLTGLPRTICSLNSACSVDLSRCRNLSETIRNRLRDATQVAAYAGPRFHFSMEHAEVSQEKQPAKAILAAYYIEAKKEALDLPNVFNETNQDEFDSLTNWMNKLSYMADHRSSSDTKQWLTLNILDYLEKAETNENFREIFFAQIIDAATTCGDRVALSVIQIGIAYDLDQKKEIAEIADFMKTCVFPMKLLEECARNKIPSLRFFDEIEVYLGYPVKLKERLQIPINVQNMLYFACSALTEQDLNEAEAFVLNKVNNPSEFHQSLMKEQKWIDVLKIRYATEFTALEAVRDKASEALPEDSSPDAYLPIETAFNLGLLDLTKKAIEAIYTKKADLGL